MNNKILSVVLVAGIATTGFATLSSADDSATGSVTNKIKAGFERLQLTDEQKAEREAIKSLMQKKRDGETLTAEETTTIEDFIANNPHKGEKRGAGKGHGKKGGKMGKNLTDEEKTALEAMSDDEKKAFFEAKKEERQVQKLEAKSVMDKIIAGTTLSSTEEATRLEIVAKFAEREENSNGKRGNHTGENAEIMKKLVNLEALTDEEKTTLAEMQAKREERTAAKEAISPILEKKKTGEELSEDEEAQLEAFKSEYKGDRKGGKRGGHRGMNR